MILRTTQTTGTQSRFNEAIAHIILMSYTLFCLFPIILIVINSFKTKKGIFREPLQFPNSKTFSLEGYYTVLTQGNFGLYFFNSITVTTISIVLIILLGSMAAYALSEYRFTGNSLLTLYFAIGIMIPIRLGTIAILKLVVSLKLINTLTALILVYTAQGLPLAIFILNEFMHTISNEIKDAARVDGLSEISIFFKIIVPIMRPAIATVMVFSMIPVWNDLWFPLILASGDKVKTITLGAQQFMGQYVTDWTSILAVLSLAIFPVLLLYMIFSKQIIRGITAGSVK